MIFRTEVHLADFLGATFMSNRPRKITGGEKSSRREDVGRYSRQLSYDLTDASARQLRTRHLCGGGGRAAGQRSLLVHGARLHMAVNDALIASPFLFRHRARVVILG